MNQTQPQKASPCRNLKSKNSFGLLEDSSNWYGIEDPNATYWCIKSSGAAGPDNGIVSPKTCVKGRKCFKAA